MTSENAFISDVEEVELSEWGECCICYEEIHNDVHCKNKHVMCAGCFIKIRDSVPVPSCPMCRTPINNQFEYRFLPKGHSR